MVICCQHSLFAHQTVRAAPLLRLTSAAQAGEAFGFDVTNNSSTCQLVYLFTCQLSLFLIYFFVSKKICTSAHKCITSWCIICLPLCRCRADIMQMKDIMMRLATMPALIFVRRLASSLKLCFSLFTMCQSKKNYDMSMLLICDDEKNTKVHKYEKKASGQV